LDQKTPAFQVFVRLAPSLDAGSTVSTDMLFAGIRLARRAGRKRKLFPYEHGML